MKRNISILLLAAGLLPCITQAQGTGAAQPYQQMVRRLAANMGVEDNFVLQAYDVTEQACARMIDGERKIYFNDAYLKAIEKLNGRWGVYFILAHEMAHHINNHTSNAGAALTDEQSADRTAGRMLKELNATEEEALRWVSTCTMVGDPNHPNRDTRIAEVKKGWESAELRRGNRFDFFDDFSNNNNTWYLGLLDTYTVVIEAGKLSVEAKNNQAINAVALKNFNIDLNKDFSAQVKTIWVSGAENHPFGLILCGDRSTRSYFTFLISASGSFVYEFLRKNGKWETVLPWTASPLIKKKGTNILSCEKRGQILTLKINGQKVADVDYDGYMNDFGVYVAGQQSVDFDDFTLKGTNKQ